MAHSRFGPEDIQRNLKSEKLLKNTRVMLKGFGVKLVDAGQRWVSLGIHGP